MNIEETVNAKCEYCGWEGKLSECIDGYIEEEYTCPICGKEI